MKWPTVPEHLRTNRPYLEHLLTTAEDFQRTYADRGPTPDFLIQLSRDRNDAEINELRRLLAELDD